MPATWKDPRDIFDYQLDFTPDLQPGEVVTGIISATSTNAATGVDSSAAIIGSSPAPYVDSPFVILWLQGGNTGERHNVEIVVSTDQSRQYTGVLVLDILEI
jgi:hypothetical protein